MIQDIFSAQPLAAGSRAASSSWRTTTSASARYLVQGVDVWLNNPRRPLEASGTSGMKAAMNGVVNCSVLDGWWDEGYETASNGWAIGGRETRTPTRAPRTGPTRRTSTGCSRTRSCRCYYDRDEDGLPRGWLTMMRASMASTIWRFSTTRMLQEYVEQMYLAAAREEAAEHTENGTGKRVAGWPALVAKDSRHASRAMPCGRPTVDPPPYALTD